jgi:hypothetical protein
MVERVNWVAGCLIVNNTEMKSFGLGWSAMTGNRVKRKGSGFAPWTLMWPGST